MQAIRITRPTTVLPSVLEATLPPHLADAVHCLGVPHPEELRLHAKRYASVRAGARTYKTAVTLSEQELSQILKRMCGGSLYAYAETINQGYLTLEGGIRVGVCGSAACENGRVIGVNRITGLTARIPHAVDVSTDPLTRVLSSLSSSTGLLIYSPPGVGKTTLLRALARRLSSPSMGLRAVVVDSREEMTGTLEGEELSLDVLTGYPRALGIEIAVRSLSAQVILCDEIGSAEDAAAILMAANCGVPLISSAHARDVREILLRPPLRQLHDAHVFGTYVGLSRPSHEGLSFCITSWQEADRYGRQT